jgi:hypothetical protein
LRSPNQPAVMQSHPYSQRTKVAVLHHGFSISTHLGGDLLLVFANKNLSKAHFKVVNPLLVVQEIPIRKSRTFSGSPTLQGMFGANRANEFMLNSHLEEIPISTGGRATSSSSERYLTAIWCSRSIEAKTLAFDIVGDLTCVPESNPNMLEDKAGNVEEAKRDVEALLAFLWKLAKGGLTVIRLADILESPQLNHQCELLHQKVKQGGTTPTVGGAIGVPTARITSKGGPDRGGTIP